MTVTVKSPKKLIEVALPLDAINEASAREKSIRQGHPSTLHLWWARRPLAAARALLFAQMVNDPSWKGEMEHAGELPPSNLRASWAAGRKRLFEIIRDLVKWENTSNEEVLEKARAEIRKSWRDTCELNKDHPQAAQLFDPEKLPAFHDPFAGGGALPLEARRLGLESYASDLNPVAVLINKAMIEFPPTFAGKIPVNPEAQSRKTLLGERWAGNGGIVDDIRYYGRWMRDQARARVGGLYPSIEITPQMAEQRTDLKHLVGQKLTVISWLWARTVKSPNPAFNNVDVPLASTFLLSTKKGKEAYVEPVIENGGYRFEVKLGKSLDGSLKNGTKLARGANFSCVMSGTPISPDYVKAEGAAGRLGARMMAIVAEGPKGRLYLTPTSQHERSSKDAVAAWAPELNISGSTQYLGVKPYGMDRFDQLFTQRQLVVLDILSDLIADVSGKIRSDIEVANAKGTRSDSEEYAKALVTCLAMCVSRQANRSATLNVWDQQGENVQQVFGMQALRMTWDFVEGNPFSDSTGNFLGQIDYFTKVLEVSCATGPVGHAVQADAQTQTVSLNKVISTDPPYYDNVPYADLSDFFYVWLRRCLRNTYPEMLATLAVPKAEELVAFAYRHVDGKSGAEAFFLDGMTAAMQRLVEQAHPAFPTTIYYAFRQSETEDEQGTASTGWETFLDAVISAGYSVLGTWPVRTEYTSHLKTNRNALASSIVLACLPRPQTAESISRRAFQRELNQVLPEALDEMTRGSGDDRSPVAPVDLSQAIIGPGMAVFSKYAAVLEADGTPMTVRAALQLINRFLAEDDFDHDTQFCLHWFEQFGWAEGKFGDADTLARAKGTSVDGVKAAGVLYASGGVVKLLKWSDYPTEWDASADDRLPVWEALHHLVRVFKSDGEGGAGKVLAATAAQAESTRQLAYRLYTLCERAGRAEDARAYNEIVTSWAAIESAAAAAPKSKQSDLFG